MSVRCVLFVCTGNSCRSVMAQRLFEHTARQAGVESVNAASAGIFAVEGMAATLETQRVLQTIGVDVSDHRARRVTSEMVEEADTVFVMEQFQRDELLKRFPGLLNKLHLLKIFGVPIGQREPHVNIPDPIGKPMEVYEVCFAEIRTAIARVAESMGIQSA